MTGWADLRTRMYPGAWSWVVSDTAQTSEEVHVDRR